jgi:hypothetical protein
MVDYITIGPCLGEPGSQKPKELGFYAALWLAQAGLRLTGPGAGRWTCNGLGQWRGRAGQSVALREKENQAKAGTSMEQIKREGGAGRWAYNRLGR